MTVMKVGFQGGVLLLMGLLAACGSSTPLPETTVPAGVDGGVTAASCAGSAFAWKEDGTAQCASSWVTSGLHGGTPGNPDDTVEIVGTQGLAIGISISVAAPPPLGGTYGCSPSPAGIAELTYRDMQTSNLTVESCSVTVALLGDADGGADAGAVLAVGTFSAVLSVPDAGTTKNLTDGAFDVLVKY